MFVCIAAMHFCIAVTVRSRSVRGLFSFAAMQRGIWPGRPLKSQTGDRSLT